MSDTIKCILRLKPSECTDPDKKMNEIVIKQTDQHTLFVESKYEKMNYKCDYVAGENSTQQEIYDEVGLPIVKSFFQGYNCTVFSYGQTGSGKTYTMMGPLNSILKESHSDKKGLIPRIVKQIYLESSTLKNEKKLSSITIKCSCFEIYQETIIDLFNNKHDNLNIREDAKKNMFIENLTDQVAEDEKTALELIMLGMKNRHVAATTMNSDSSRSHMIFSILMNINFTNESGLVSNKVNKLHLIDLAGSERQKSTQVEKKGCDRVKESATINK